MTWEKYFDVQRHAVYKDDPRSKIMILTQQKENDEKKIDEKLDRARFEVIDVTNLDSQALMDKIFRNEQFGSPTNLIINIENVDLNSTEKLTQIFEDLRYGCKVQMNAENFKFIELREGTT